MVRGLVCGAQSYPQDLPQEGLAPSRPAPLGHPQSSGHISAMATVCPMGDMECAVVLVWDAHPPSCLS